MKSRLFNLAAVLFLLCHRVPECAASILDSNKSWLDAPEAIFARELKNAGLISGEESNPAPAEESYRERTLQAELQDLAEALSKSGKTNSARILEAYQQTREAIAFRQDNPVEEALFDGEKAEKPADPFEAIEGLGSLDLPAEFLLYLKGAAHWRLGNKGSAVNYWRKVLDLPIAERNYRSTWAAYMLARNYVKTAPARAHEMLDTLRRLAAAGFSDRLNLAEDSMGWEAAAYLHEGEYAKAIELYLRLNDLESVRITAASAIDHAAALKLRELAENETTQKVITSFLISGGLRAYMDEQSLSIPGRFSTWEAAIDAAKIQNVWVAERLALCAYQARDFDAAHRWIEASAGSTTSERLRAKLHLQDGEVDQAATVLRALAPRLPLEEDCADLSCNLTIRTEYGRDRPVRRRIFAELGVVELNRQNFLAALDAFLEGEYWTDAAFTAERILTIEELKKYVDSHPNFVTGGDNDPRVKLRTLLARRLMRLNQIRDARAYFPAQLQSVHDSFTEALQTGFDQSESYDTRARNFVEAARITREHGLDLFGTELEPDWHIHDGTSEFGLTSETRMNTAADALPPSEAEIARIKASALPFSKRFHYRYVAAELAWIASLLMPNNDDQTARVLWESGSWVKNLDATYADKFYKSLVRRNRGTELGARADKLRWFPSLEERPPLSAEPR